MSYAAALKKKETTKTLPRQESPGLTSFEKQRISDISKGIKELNQKREFLQWKEENKEVLTQMFETSNERLGRNTNFDIFCETVFRSSRLKEEERTEIISDNFVEEEKEEPEESFNGGFDD